MVNKNVYLVTKVDCSDDMIDGCTEHWAFMDKEIAEKFLETMVEKNDVNDIEYDIECVELEDNYLQFNYDKTELVGRCLSVTKESDHIFNSKIEDEKTLSDLIDEFDDYSYGIQKENTIKERIPYWLKYDECSELEEKLKKYL